VDIQLDIDGIIREGLKTGWSIRIEYDPEDTGGYYIYTSNNDEGYDSWILNYEDLEAVFHENKWVVDWNKQD